MSIRKSAIALMFVTAFLLVTTGVAKSQILSREAMAPGTTGPLIKIGPPRANSGVTTCGDYFLFFKKGLVGNAEAVLFAFDATTPSGEKFPALPGFYAKKLVNSHSDIGVKVPILRVISAREVEVLFPPQEMRLASCLEDSSATH